MNMRVTALLVLLPTRTVVCPALAQTGHYPNKVIRWVVPFANDIGNEAAMWARVIKQAGIKLD